MKKKLLISFSGGRTSAYMTKMLLDNFQDIYEMIVVFANTGREREETLEFVRECDKRWNFNTIWVECEPKKEMGKGVQAKVVTFKTASRNGEPFKKMIQKYGIPNVQAPMCTRILKNQTIRTYMREQGYKKYFTAIGIRYDEIDRINPNHKKERIIYPFISMYPTKKSDVNLFWSKQDFDLRLKSYEGNCDVCFKKSLRKLLTIANENPELFDWWQDIETEFENFMPKSRSTNNITFPLRIFRDNLSVKQILIMSKEFTHFARDDSKDIDKYKQLELFQYELDVSNGCTESCEPF